MHAREEALDAQLVTRRLDAHVIGCDNGTVQAFGFKAPLMDMPEQRLAAEAGQRFAGKARSAPTAGNYGEVPARRGAGTSN
jgi:hypothetical protein